MSSHNPETIEKVERPNQTTVHNGTVNSYSSQISWPKY